MHEFSIATYLLETVEQKAQELGARRVLAINLLVGDRACIVDESLAFCFQMLAPDTRSQDAMLNIRHVPMQFDCGVCGVRFQPVGGDFRCPTCGEVGQIADDGSEFVIESIEIERGDSP